MPTFPVQHKRKTMFVILQENIHQTISVAAETKLGNPLGPLEFFNHTSFYKNKVIT